VDIVAVSLLLQVVKNLFALKQSIPLGKKLLSLSFALRLLG
jgi:hypothetical protein